MICEKVDEEQTEEKESSDVATCPPDPRFQQQNKTKWCYNMFVDFYRCSHYFGPTHKFCTMFEKCYKSLCPNYWIEKWEADLKAGTFPRDITKEMGN
ncbi:unnamed protein product [Nesidiocoris tenuis]|uniref:Cytochrome c oxidase subunit n=1 Tax=Nesidiocoris tenuis TaxID=355587 RepID=A0A6H5HRE9_9HEMI|nr:unnamed protein product [Nesidiocoris tenuis]CAB0020657.1 unnamed protein product [Nesidiocoris tenuis]